MSPKRSYRDKVVLITGAGGGMGTAFAEQFGRAGSILCLLDISSGPVKRLASRLTGKGIQCLWLQCDVADEEDCRRAVKTVLEKFGRIDLLINNAGITHRSAFLETDTAVLRKVMDISLFGSVNCTKASLESLIKHSGQIIIISSVAGFAPLLGRSGYCAAKHAMHGLFGSLRAELSGTGVDVLIVCPGFTRTGISDAALDGNGAITSYPQSTSGRIALPEEVARRLFNAARRNRKLLVLSAVGKLSWFLTRLTPSLYLWIMKHSLKSELNRN